MKTVDFKMLDYHRGLLHINKLIILLLHALSLCMIVYKDIINMCNIIVHTSAAAIHVYIVLHFYAALVVIKVTFAIQSEVNRKPIVTCSYTFSHNLRQRHAKYFFELIGSLDYLRLL